MFSRIFWRTPAVRHLAWLTHSVSLACNSLHPLFDPHPPEGLLSALQTLDANPRPLLDILARRSHRRLGVYFEDLYRFALETFWQREVVLQNQPIRSHERTLGELDFIVRHKESGRYEHHEIAIKFYLGCYPSRSPDGDWLGPDRRDRLQDKLDKLSGHQASLTRHPLTQELLQSRAIEPVEDLIFLRGYLFYPIRKTPPPLPEGIAAGHSRGQWLTLDQARSQGWQPQCPVVQLQKPDWLGPLQLRDGALPLAQPHYLESLALIAERAFPMLFARLEWQDAGFWLETARFFVAPDGWPNL